MYASAAVAMMSAPLWPTNSSALTAAHTMLAVAASTEGVADGAGGGAVIYDPGDLGLGEQSTVYQDGGFVVSADDGAVAFESADSASGARCRGKPAGGPARC